MFKSLKYKSDTYNAKNYTMTYIFEIIDSDFTANTTITVNAKDGTEANSIATAALIQEYSNRKLHIHKNLAIWYIDRLHEYEERILDLMDKDKKYIDRYFIDLKYNKIMFEDTKKIVEKKIKEFHAADI